MNGKKFKHTLKVNNITQEEAAKMLNVTRNTIARWCKMDDIPEENRDKIIDIFGKNGITVSKSNIEGSVSSNIRSNVIGDGNNISHSDFTSFIELLKKKDDQIDRLLGIIEKLSI